MGQGPGPLPGPFRVSFRAALFGTRGSRTAVERLRSSPAGTGATVSGAPWAKARAPRAEMRVWRGAGGPGRGGMRAMSTISTSAIPQAATSLDEQRASAASASAERPLTTADRCDVCAAQAYVRVVLLTGELFFCAHHAREHGERLKEVALLFQDETASLTAGS